MYLDGSIVFFDGNDFGVGAILGGGVCIGGILGRVGAKVF